jgi:uncharacterized protein DUF4365
VPRKYPPDPRKRRTRAHVLADLSVHHVEGIALRCGYTVQPVEPDYGLDLMLFTYTPRGEVENGFVWMQLKATDRLRWRRDRQALVVRVQRAHLLYWLREHYPVILIVYDGIREAAYWLHIQGSLGKGEVFRLRRTGTTITLHVPVDNIVNEAAMRRFAGLRAARAPWGEK